MLTTQPGRAGAVDIVVSLTSADPGLDRVELAFAVARVAATAGKRVVVFLAEGGAELATAEAMESSAVIAPFVASGGEVWVSQSSAVAREIQASVPDGVALVTGPAFARCLLDGARCIAI